MIEDPTITKFIEFVPSQNKWKCLSCSKTFSTSYNVSNHIKQKHMQHGGGDVGADHQVTDSGEESEEYQH
jgi:hypothetical protein